MTRCDHSERAICIFCESGPKARAKFKELLEESLADLPDRDFGGSPGTFSVYDLDEKRILASCNHFVIYIETTDHPLTPSAKHLLIEKSKCRTIGLPQYHKQKEESVHLHDSSLFVISPTLENLPFP